MPLAELWHIGSVEANAHDAQFVFPSVAAAEASAVLGPAAAGLAVESVFAEPMPGAGLGFGSAVASSLPGAELVGSAVAEQLSAVAETWPVDFD